MSDDSEKATSVSDMVTKIIENKVDINRRYIDEILQKMQERNRKYFLDRYNDELAAMEENERGDTKKAMRHQILADTYKSIAERCFAG